MIEQFADITELFLGFSAYPKGDIVNFISSTTGQSKTIWNNKSDAIYWAYYSAVKDKNYSAWTPANPTGSERTIKYVQAQTGLPRNDIYRYLLSLYTMANMGKLETVYWNPAGAGKAEEYGQAKVVQNVKNALNPVTQVASAPAKQLLTGILVAGGITAIGIFASKEFIKQKEKTIRKRVTSK